MFRSEITVFRLGDRAWIYWGMGDNGGGRRRCSNHGVDFVFDATGRFVRTNCTLTVRPRYRRTDCRRFGCAACRGRRTVIRLFGGRGSRQRSP
jgi:hypothetical protein